MEEISIISGENTNELEVETTEYLIIIKEAVDDLKDKFDSIDLPKEVKEMFEVYLLLMTT